MRITGPADLPESKSEKSEKTPHSSQKKHSTKAKTDSEGAAAQVSGSGKAKDAHVSLSAEAKSAAAAPTPATHAAPEPNPDKEITAAEKLMEHVNSGKLSPDEKEMAMHRVGEIVKKYGNA